MKFIAMKKLKLEMRGRLWRLGFKLRHERLYRRFNKSCARIHKIGLSIKNDLKKIRTTIERVQSDLKDVMQARSANDE